MFKCICFDLDNTLFPEASYYEACYKEIARMISRSEEEQISEKILRIRREEGDNKIFQKIIDLYSLDNNYLDKFIEIYRTHNARISLFFDVEKYLNTKKNKLKHGILTNGGEMTQKNKIKCLGIKECFEFILVSGQYLHKDDWKPNKKAFELISSYSGFKLNECIYVGDSFEKDIIGALNSGMNAVLINREAEFERCKLEGNSYWVINTFNIIDDIIKEVED